jgi:hypothetical protein
VGRLRTGIAFRLYSQFRFIIGLVYWASHRNGHRGAVVESGLAGMRLRRLFGFVLFIVLLSAITTILLQTFGVVPTTRIK